MDEIFVLLHSANRQFWPTSFKRLWQHKTFKARKRDDWDFCIEICSILLNVRKYWQMIRFKWSKLFPIKWTILRVFLKIDATFRPLIEIIPIPPGKFGSGNSNMVEKNENKLHLQLGIQFLLNNFFLTMMIIFIDVFSLKSLIFFF